MVTQSQFTISEQFIIGAIFKHPKAALTILNSQKATPDWFEQPVTNTCLRAIFDLVKTNVAIEPASVLTQIHALDPKTTITIEDLHHCNKMCSSTSNLLHHVTQLKDRRTRNEVDEILTVGRQKLDAGEPTAELIEQMKWLFQGLNSATRTTSADVIDEVLALYSQSMQQGYTGIPSRWPCMMRILGGYPKRGVTVISGLTKHGKTTYCCNELINMVRQNRKVLFISLEMSEGQIRAILAGDELDLDLVKLRNGELKGDERTQEFARFKQCLEAHRDLPMDIIDGSKTIGEIDSLIRGASGEYDAVIVDHLHLIRKGSGEPSSKEERLSLYSQTITNSTNDANLATLLIAQLSRDGTVDRNGDPVMPEPRHLKGSGSIEQDATILLFVCQDPRQGKELMVDNAPTLIRVALNRLGRVGTERFMFLKSKQKLISQAMWELHEMQPQKKEEENEEIPF
jgi:replicative DNA helicase